MLGRQGRTQSHGWGSTRFKDKKMGLIPAILFTLMGTSQFFISGHSHVLKQEIKYVRNSIPHTLPGP